ncbi:MAG: Unknown protein [uncultured Sulfurovum sp.]|uniref:Uncharacterized protein n=1 Tax=uncultured Sulfurovum sp. TaxID=269237 RepID=A0A6S6TB32_9BACT|nr:MAG: Unknown protein [uncultured Sulfurovum sp.]
MKAIVVVFIILLQFTGCTYTMKTWNEYDKEEYYGVIGDDTLPQTLTDKNVTFSCKDMIYSSVGHTKKCYVKKETAPEINYWAKRILLTTAMGVAETAGNIMVVSFYVLIGAIQSAGQ